MNPKTTVDVELGGTLYRLVPGPKALLRVAAEVGDPLHLALAMGRAEPPGVVNVFAVMRIALAESGYTLTEERANELLFQYGVLNLMAPYAEFVAALANCGKVPEPAALAAATAQKKSRPSRRTGRA